MDINVRKYLNRLVEGVIKEYNTKGLMTTEEIRSEILSEHPGCEIIYHRPDTRKNQNILNDLFSHAFSREFTGSNGGNMYGAGVYTVRNLGSTEHSNYGSVIVIGFVEQGFKDFLIWDVSLAKKYYGANYRVENQLRALASEGKIPEHVAKKIIYEVKQEYRSFHMSDEDPYSSNVFHWITKNFWADLEKSKIRGAIYRGRNDGDCALVFDFGSVVPYGYTKNGKMWEKRYNQNLVDYMSNNMDVGFDLKYKTEDNGKQTYKSVSLVTTNGYAVVTKEIGGKAKVNYVSAKTKKLISDVWFDGGTAFDEDGIAEVTYNGQKFYLYDDGKTIRVLEKYGDKYTEVCELSELPQNA